MKTSLKFRPVVLLGAFAFFVSFAVLTPGVSSAFAVFTNLTYEDQLIQAGDPAASDTFGRQVAVSGETMIVGSPADDDNGTQSGSAYVFEREGGVWLQKQKLRSPFPEVSGQFGNAVDIDGDTLIVGAWAELADDRGSAYVFERTSGVWSYRRRLRGSDVGGVGASAKMGESVAVHGDFVALSSRIGRVWVFHRDTSRPDGWSASPIATLTGGGGFGASGIAMAGDLLVVSERSVGAHLFDAGLMTFPLIRTITRAQVGGTADWFSSAVATDGNTVVVADLGADSATVANHGAAYIFGRNQGGTGAWGLIQKVVPSEVAGGQAQSRQMGESTAVSGDIVVVGTKADSIQGKFSGSAYVFQRNEGGTDNWGETHRLIPTNGEPYHYFGFSAAMTGGTAIVSAPGYIALQAAPHLPGHVYAFDISDAAPPPPPPPPPSSVPGVPTLSGPSGGGISATPTYTWNEVADATSYRIQIIQSGVASIYLEYHDAGSICSGGTCSVATPPAPVLVAGDHVWRVQGKNSIGNGDWSSYVSFTVTGGVPGATTLSAPLGNITDSTPDYVFDAVSGADRYQLHVVHSGVGAVHSALHNAADVCSGATCTIGSPPVSTLVPGEHVWRVRALNDTGAGDWTAYSTFSVAAATPGAATLTFPSGNIFDTTPSYSWGDVAGSTSYQLHVIEAGVGSVYSTVHAAAGICAAGTCTVDSPPVPQLVPGSDYVWRVRGFNEAGTGAWSPFTSFSLSGVKPGPPTLTGPSGSIATTTPTYTWSVSPGATRYQLHIVESGVAAIHSQQYGDADICSGGLCAVGPGDVPAPPTLKSGSGYVFRVRAYNEAGWGAWTTFQSFSVQ